MGQGVDEDEWRRHPALRGRVLMNDEWRRHPALRGRVLKKMNGGGTPP